MAGHESSSLPAVDRALRRQLLTQANRLAAKVVVGRAGLTDAVVAQVRQVFEKIELLKVRVEAERGAEADEVGEQLAYRVPCHCLRRVGKVLILYRPPLSKSNE